MAGWTEERVELLKKLWGDGLSGGQIAARLGGFEHCADKGRSAVCGKVWRIRLAPRPTTQKFATINMHRRRAARLDGDPAPARAYKKHRRPSRYGAQPSPVYAILHDGLPLPPPHETDVARVSFDDAEAHHCHWIPASIDPRGWPQNKPLYCGEKTAANTAYCRDHLKRLHGAPEIPEPPKPKAPARQPTFYEQMEDVA